MSFKKYKELPVFTSKKEKYALLVGAGISFNSGIPTVSYLIERIVNRLPFDKRDRVLFLNQKFPFESFIQVLKSIIPIDEFLRVFTLGRPNHTHKFIAKLAKHNQLSLVITTNFDTLLEQAFESESVSYKKEYSTERLEKVRISNKLALLKIHGSIEDMDNLGVVLKRITSKTNIQSVQNAIHKLFFHKTHSKIVILGYSCSDFFDVVPELENSSKSSKEILYVQDKEISTTIEKPISSIDPFSKHKNGKVIYTKTDWLIKQAWTSFFDETFPYSESHSKKWESIVDKWLVKWALSNDNINGLILCGRLMVLVGYYELALKYYDSALSIAMDNSIVEKLAKIKSYMAQVYRHIGEYSSAIDCFNDSLEYWRKISRDNYAKALSDIGSTYRLARNYKMAIDYQRKAIRIFKKTHNTLEVKNCLIIIGNIYLNTERDTLALKNYQKAEDLSSNISDKQSEVILLNSLASVCIKLDKLPLAYSYLQKASKISSKLGVQRIVIAVESNWGSYYYKNGDYRNAIKKHTIAYKIALKTEDKYQLFLILKSRMSAYAMSGLYKKALIDADLCISLAKGKPELKNEYGDLQKTKRKLSKLGK
ncbi:MAG: tetratricopeptide repeat protein [Chitinophagales bacterium]|nr:tetratricopeptide repeat protein [Chitinophagales bacterium]